MTKPETEMCPCCGYDRPPAKAPAVLTMCPACFFVNSPAIDTADHRAAWMMHGANWMSVKRSPPKDWNPINTLARLALKITRAKTKGRPPRMNPNL